ncbi:hypothetical protein GCM10010441_61090 [Kitasatospora paracochleata]
MATPSSGPSGAAEYMHIGLIHTRLGMVSERRVIGSNRALTAAPRRSAGAFRKAATITTLVREMSNYDASRTMVG